MTKRIIFSSLLTTMVKFGIISKGTSDNETNTSQKGRGLSFTLDKSVFRVKILIKKRWT